MTTSIIQHRSRPRNWHTPRTAGALRREIDQHVSDLVARGMLWLTYQQEIEDDGPNEVLKGSQDVLDIYIADTTEELDRMLSLYERFKGHPYAATIPDRSSERYQRLLDTAADLKQVWPAERFAAEILGMRLEGRGRVLSGDCPFHDSESHRSFKVYTDTDTFWCFGCFQRGDGIDIFAVLGRWQHLVSFREQVEWLADYTSVVIGGER